MRNLRIVLIAVVFAMLVMLVACSAPSAPAGGTGSTGGTGTSGSTGTSGGGSSAVAVSLQNFAFNPSDIQVAVGGTVTFTNNDSTTHNVAGDTWSSGPMAPGKSFAQKFPTAGTFPIKCTIHPSMTAQVTVK
jgi:plastocyanin